MFLKALTFAFETDVCEDRNISGMPALRGLTGIKT